MNLTRRLLNTAYVGAYALVERTIPFWPIEWIERLQRYRLRAIIRHAYDSVPFYRQALDERGLRPNDFRTVQDLSKLPLIDGTTVWTDPEAFLSTRYSDDSRSGFYSAGSASGVPRQIYWDNVSLLRKLAYHERDRPVLDRLAGPGSRQSRVYILPPEATGFRLRAFWESATLIPRRYRQSYVLSSEQPFDTVADRINLVRPKLIASYGSYAEHFFRFLADRHMTIPLPRVWAYGADTISPSGRELIENTFGCRTYSTYQSTETGRLGFQCEQRQGFHLNIDLCAVRLVDEDGRTVRPGELGEVVISNLHNRAMVLLNYRLGDWGVMASEACSCGRSLPVLDSLEGRTGEVLRFPDGRIMTGLALGSSCKEQLKSMIQVQIVQPASGWVKWRIVPFSSADREALRRDLLDRCRLVLGEDTPVEVEFVEEIPSTPQGKFIRVVSHVEAPDTPGPITQGES